MLSNYIFVGNQHWHNLKTNQVLRKLWNQITLILQGWAIFVVKLFYLSWTYSMRNWFTVVGANSLIESNSNSSPSELNKLFYYYDCWVAAPGDSG